MNIFPGQQGKLGAWYLKPTTPTSEEDEKFMLLLHGNGGSRAWDPRIESVQLLADMGYHVLALDYRGFGDSDGFPSEEGLLDDSKRAYKWLRQKSKGRPLYVVGHR